MTSAPSANGRWSTGVANVLSTTAIAPARCASSMAPARSMTRSSGFDGLSSHTTFAGFASAAASRDRSVMSTTSVTIPHRSRKSRAATPKP
jgi:hypothetical protein